MKKKRTHCSHDGGGDGGGGDDGGGSNPQHHRPILNHRQSPWCNHQ